jgi:hypothetical protein
MLSCHLHRENDNYNTYVNVTYVIIFSIKVGLKIRKCQDHSFVASTKVNIIKDSWIPYSDQ